MIRLLRRGHTVHLAVCLCLAGSFAALAPSGCGGNSSSPDTSGVTAPESRPAETGRVAVRFEWPALGNAGETRAIPRFARLIRVTVEQKIGDTWQPIAQQERQRPESTTSTQEVFTFNDIPKGAGGIRLVARAYESGAAATLMATAIANVDFINVTELTLGSDVTNLSLDKAVLDVNVGASDFFTVTAKNGSAIVMLSPDTEIEIVSGNSNDFTENLIVERVNVASLEYRVTGRRRQSTNQRQVLIARLRVPTSNQPDGTPRVVPPAQIAVGVKTRVEFYETDVSTVRVTPVFISPNDRRLKLTIRLGDTLSYRVRGDQNIDSDRDQPSFSHYYRKGVGEGGEIAAAPDAELKQSTTTGKQEFAPQQPGIYILRAVEIVDEQMNKNEAESSLIVEVTGTPTLSGSASPLRGAEEVYTVLIGNRPPAPETKVTFFLRSNETGNAFKPLGADTDLYLKGGASDNTVKFRVPLTTASGDEPYRVGVAIGEYGDGNSLTDAEWDALKNNEQAVDIPATVKPVTLDITPGSDAEISAPEVAKRQTALSLESLTIGGAAYKGTPEVTWSTRTGDGGRLISASGNDAVYEAGDSYTTGDGKTVGITAGVKLTPAWEGAAPVAFTKQEFFRVKTGSVSGTIR